MSKMKLAFTPVAQLKPDSEKEIWKIKVRVVRMWRFQNGIKPGDGGIDLILLDDKGDRIQACIRGKLISKFEEDMGEGKCYVIREIVGPCDLKEITVRNAPCKILNLQLKDCGMSKDVMATTSCGSLLTLSNCTQVSSDHIPFVNRKTISQLLTSYEVHCKVLDHTGTTSFVMFDREAIQLIHKSAYELLEQQVQFNSGNEFPRELLALEGREFVFTINKPETSKNYTPSTFKVVNMNDDPAKILRFHSDDANETDIPAIGPHFSNYTETTMSLVNDVFEESNNSISASTESTSTPTKKRASTLAIEDCVPQISSKKLKGDISLLAEEDGQLSSTKSKPKVGHVTKDDCAKPSSTKQRKAANLIPKKEKN
uniref:Replication protein A 70 kDa DNA-binding subunit B/D first OB fold domain-containing protein n=1 Tax=Brassica oleracea TaxID=3712 RepID=A0A3P6EFM8_BRAOL|nr:unnamed protein product [Brassica oleracea]